MGATPTVRLVSPTGRRIYPNATTGAKQSDAGSICRKTREGVPIGRADLVTARCLSALGWKRYTGPAETDERGFVIPGTDPVVDALRNGGSKR